MPQICPTIATPLKLPCGVVLSNRLVKAAMTEGLADIYNRATDGHVTLYRRWSSSGAALLLTGNVQVDRRYMERPGNVAIDGAQTHEQLQRLKAFADAGKNDGKDIWVQLSHAGRCTPSIITPEPIGPSEKPLDYYGKAFGKPRAMTEEDVLDVIARFTHAARVVRDCGFAGLQLHAAHGYLLNSFLSPDVNDRKDEWGGSLENRARLLLDIVGAVRSATGGDFPISVKLNSADFQKGGFSHEEAITVARWLDQAKIDLLEISGGTYEQPKMLLADRAHILADRSVPLKVSSIAREAYFLEYARAIRTETTLPMMVTGGFRSRGGMNAALASGATDAIGLGRPLCMDPHFARRLLDGEVDEAERWEEKLKLDPNSDIFKALSEAERAGVEVLGPGLWFQYQVMQMGRGSGPNSELGLFEGMSGLQNNDVAAAEALRW